MITSMFGRKCTSILAALLATALSSAASAYEESALPFRGLQIWPGSETGEQMQIKSLSVRAIIHDGIAETTLTTVFKNDISQQCQASLDLGVPRGGVVVGYSYWFKGERINAVLMDNDRAWEIYQTITSHGRDPAIMEQWGNERYHLQIYPVEPKKDLRVEIRYIAPLEGDRGVLFYQAPISHNGNMPQLESFDGEVRLQGLRREQLSNTLNVEPAWEGGAAGGLTYKVHKEDWKPDKDWILRIRQPHQALNAYVSGGPSGGRDGFFVLILSSDRPVKNARVRLSGLKTWNVSPRRVTIPNAGGTAIVTGRYAREGALRVRLGKSQYMRARVPLSNAPNPNSPATKFYAARRIKDLCGRVEPWRADTSRRALRRTVIATSLRFGVVSPYTAWLAVPNSEMDFFRKLKAEGKTQTNAERVQGGDPYIDVNAPEDTVRVVALFPDGRIMNLERDPKTDHFRGQFDIPCLTPEGDYVVTLIIVSEDGRRRHVRLVYHVDRSAPDGQADKLSVSPGSPVTVALQTEPDVARVEVLTPWNQRKSLTLRGDSWSGAIEIPDDAIPGSYLVRFVITDGAHNQTIVTTDLVVMRGE